MLVVQYAFYFMDNCVNDAIIKITCLVMVVHYWYQCDIDL